MHGLCRQYSLHAFKLNWEIFIKIIKKSGWTYFKEFGANIQPEQKSSWDAWAFDIIYPVATAIAHNTGVCWSGCAESEEWDIERMEPEGDQNGEELVDSQKRGEETPTAAAKEGNIIVGEDVGSVKDMVGVVEALGDESAGVGDENATQAASPTPLPLAQGAKQTKSLDSISSTPKPRLAHPQHVTPTQHVDPHTRVANALGEIYSEMSLFNDTIQQYVVPKPYKLTLPPATPTDMVSLKTPKC
uniref:Uncharacterized protein n=1 Tax=Moniliophthora roreri TaxID=221103 RepID=A0A0W0G1X5_MONRR